ncbi:MAG: hypothetical protein R3D31_06965 [Hyphomicrobiaceae bacterium]
MSSRADTAPSTDIAAMLGPRAGEADGRPGPVVEGGRPKATPTSWPREVYEAGGGRKTALSFVVLLLLPFAASIAPMLYMRLTRQLWLGTVGLGVLGLALGIIMTLLIIQLAAALRLRIVLGERAVSLRLPVARGATPLLRFKSYEVPYDEILAVETRREVYGGKVAPVLMRATRIVTRSGDKIVLGHYNEHDPDVSLPYDKIAHRIAERAEIKVADFGTVRRAAHQKLLGLVGDSERMPESEIEELNRGHARFMRGLILVLCALVAFGILSDVFLAKGG